MLGEASEIIWPQLGVGGWTPTPRNDSAASNRIAAGRNVVANTMIGAVKFGNNSLTMIRKFEAPSDLDASTNSFSRNDRTWPRMIRAG